MLMVMMVAVMLMTVMVFLMVVVRVASRERALKHLGLAVP
jgi:hypothetical protein